MGKIENRILATQDREGTSNAIVFQVDLQAQCARNVHQNNAKRGMKGHRLTTNNAYNINTGQSVQRRERKRGHFVER